MLDEIKRVATNEIIIALPNMYYYRFRFKYIFGLGLGKKYDLPHEMILDRHRWLTSYLNTKSLIEKKFNNYKINIVFGKTSNIKLIDFLDRCMQKFFPNLASHTVFYHIVLAEKLND